MWKSRGTPETEHLTSGLRLRGCLGGQLEEVALEAREGEREGEGGEGVQGVGGGRGQRGADRVKSPELRCNFVEAQRGRDARGPRGRARAAGQRGEGRVGGPARVVEARPRPGHRGHGGLGQRVLLAPALLAAPVPVAAGVHLVGLGAARALDVQLRVRVAVVRIRAPPVSAQA